MVLAPWKLRRPGRLLPEEEKPFAELYLAVEKALAEFKADRLAAIQAHEGKE